MQFPRDYQKAPTGLNDETAPPTLENPVSIFKRQARELHTRAILACDQEILSATVPENPQGDQADLGKRQFFAGTNAEDCGQRGVGNFNFTVQSRNLNPLCTATLQDEGIIFQGC